MSNCVYRGHKHSCSCTWGCCTCNGQISCQTEEEAQARDAYLDALMSEDGK